MIPADISMIISEITGLVTAVGVIVIAVVQNAQGVKSYKERGAINAKLDDHGTALLQVEKQGNSVALELKRTNMVYSRRLAVATNLGSDIAIADDAQKVYEFAAARAIKDTPNGRNDNGHTY